MALSAGSCFDNAKINASFRILRSLNATRTQFKQEPRYLH